MKKTRRNQPKTPLVPLEQPISKLPINNFELSPKISYCTTCFNRFWQLKQVVKHNLTIINQNQPAEWIIVDFGGQDSQEMTDWLNQNCPKSLVKGTLKYYRRNADLPTFVWNVSQAKNVAHRLADGQILVNLDGDNFLQKNDPEILRQLFTKNPNSLIHQTWNNFLVQYNLRSLGRGRQVAYKEYQANFSGSNGRISVARQHFMDIGGYDEEMLFMGFQDTDLIVRSVLANLDYQARKPIENDNEFRVQENTRVTLATVSSSRRGRTLRLAGVRRSPTGLSKGQISSSTQNYSSRNRDQPDPYELNYPNRWPLFNGRIFNDHVVNGYNPSRRITAPTTPLKSENQDSISNQRAKPYSNNKVKSWQEAESHNRALSHRKIGQGKLKVNVDGFKIDLNDFGVKLELLKELPKELPREVPKELPREVPEEIKDEPLSEEPRLNNPISEATT